MMWRMPILCARWRQLRRAVPLLWRRGSGQRGRPPTSARLGAADGRSRSGRRRDGGVATVVCHWCRGTLCSDVTQVRHSTVAYQHLYMHSPAAWSPSYVGGCRLGSVELPKPAGLRQARAVGLPMPLQGEPRPLPQPIIIGRHGEHPRDWCPRSLHARAHMHDAGAGAATETSH
jgi:hypothetical protein